MNKETIDQVVAEGLCTGCGTCVGLCPKDAVELEIDRIKGIYTPRLKWDLCNKCGICYEVCPGHTVDFARLNSKVFGKEPDDIFIGNYLECYTGYASEHDIRYKSASGGLVTSLLIYALEKGIIDGALVAVASEQEPLKPEPVIARSKEEILSAARSKYCPVATNVALKKIIEEEGRFAVVGLPCHIQGLRKAEVLNKALRDKIVLHLGLFCKATMTFRGTDYLLDTQGVAKANVARLEYRGSGWPGQLMIESLDGTKLSTPLFDWITHDFGFFIPFRCSLCYEQLNELADISLGDAWIPGALDDSIGTSAVISRSNEGNRFLQTASDDGRIVLNKLNHEIVRQMESKKVSFSIKSVLSRIRGQKQPVYHVSSHKVQSIPRPISLNANMIGLFIFPNLYLSSKKMLWRIIRPVRFLERIIIDITIKIAKVLQIR